MQPESLESIRLLPKIELHLHLDCSLSESAITQLIPGITHEEYLEEYTLPEKISGLEEFLSHTEKYVLLLQTQAALELAVQDIFKQLKADSVIYAEIRFAPFLHTQEGLSADEVVSIISAQTEIEIEKHGIQAGLILCTLRHFTTAQSMDTVHLVEKYRNKGVCGFDIASNEHLSLLPHVIAFEYAHHEEINCTAHCGEARGAESVVEVLDILNPTRLGHGVRCIENDDLVHKLIRERIHLEFCPTCNVQLDVVPNYRLHPIDGLYRRGMQLSVNTDNRSLTGIDLTGEYEKLTRYFGWEKADFYATNLMALRAAFTSDSIKEALADKLRSAYVD